VGDLDDLRLRVRQDGPVPQPQGGQERLLQQEKACGENRVVWYQDVHNASIGVCRAIAAA
jgi:hypothetical protein